MKRAPDRDSAATASARLAEAAVWFCRLHSDVASEEDLAAFQRWLESDSDHAAAYRRVSATWSEVGRYASTPEIMAARREALGVSRRGTIGAQQPRPSRLRSIALWHGSWTLAAALLVVAITLSVLATTGWSWRADVYSTGARERRSLTLADGSAVTLDTSSRVRVRYGSRQRLVTLEQGQACFEVAKDPARPFRIKAGDETVIALGTQLNIDMIDRDVTIALLQGHVAVLTGTPRSTNRPRVDLRTGEALRVRQDGSVTLLPRMNVDHMVAWLTGHLAFDNEPLGRAADRVSHYSQERIDVAPSVAAIGISGVFNIGDADAFIEAVTAYFPVRAIRSDGSTVHLVARDSAGATGDRLRGPVLVSRLDEEAWPIGAADQ